MSDHKLLIIAIVFAILLIAERLFAYRKIALLQKRMLANLGLAGLSNLLIYLAVPASIVVVVQGWDKGLLKLVELPFAIHMLVGILLMDLAIYVQHVAMHRYSWLWRLHSVHHSDNEFDSTLGLRFHPFEILLSYLYKLSIVLLLGISPETYLLYEILLTTFSLFTHTNISLPRWLDSKLRWVFVTPTWHRIHHSVQSKEMNSNYANLLTVWDRIFATSCERSQQDQQTMPLGLSEYSSARTDGFFGLLKMPLVRRKD